MNENNRSQHIYDLCKEHMHAYVLAETTDGKTFDGIITGLDDEHVYFAVPTNQAQPMHMQGQQTRREQYDRQYGGHYPGYGFGSGYGGYGGYGQGYYGYPPRRFDRLILPLAALTALTILPWY